MTGDQVSVLENIFVLQLLERPDSDIPFPQSELTSEDYY